MLNEWSDRVKVQTGRPRRRLWPRAEFWVGAFVVLVLAGLVLSVGEMAGGLW